MRRTVEQCPTDVVLALSACPLVDLEYANDVVIFAASSTKLRDVDIVLMLAAACELRLRYDKTNFDTRLKTCLNDDVHRAGVRTTVVVRVRRKDSFDESKAGQNLRLGRWLLVNRICRSMPLLTLVGSAKL
ncbi:hypothetical protein RB195_024530 [Necator americanus]|uniref:Reverse transcriptase domain-containing protein n=1 Tax=Necator americanus TaxID=51031 RepID=A0ABR1EQU7_NECAM